MTVAAGSHMKNNRRKAGGKIVKSALCVKKYRGLPPRIVPRFRTPRAPGRTPKHLFCRVKGARFFIFSFP